jgi:hypothetical protein
MVEEHWEDGAVAGDAVTPVVDGRASRAQPGGHPIGDLLVYRRVEIALEDQRRRHRAEDGVPLPGEPGR